MLLYNWMMDGRRANFFPALGAYSSASVETINEHMKAMQAAGTGVVVVSWYPPFSADDQVIITAILQLSHA